MKTKSSVHIPFIVILLSLILGSIVVQSAVLCTGFLKSMYSNSKENVIEISKLGTEKLSTEIENMLVPYSEIVKSPEYEAGYSLRFPVVKRIREDKGLKDIDTVERLKSMYKE